LASKKAEGEIKYSELERALKSIDNLPFVGIVESFDESIQKCEVWLQKFFPNISLKSIIPLPRLIRILLIQLKFKSEYKIFVTPAFL